MPVYERSTHVDAPLEDVWEFHSRGDGLEALTPDWMNLRIEEVTGPDGQSDPDVLDEGATIVSSVRPFGVGPRQCWTSVIVDRRESDGHALFRDEMVEGPFAAWEHTHRFSVDDDGTLIQDRVEYELAGGPVCRVVDPLAIVGLEPMFRHRHNRTSELLE